ncbi:polysaccharide pyruvyl transferase family protein [Reichenbachiella ulvae]|uniref:Polysaccharide pyruvyl transferase family protein n=1 Tax=Reichenbachiella ulvae TaxID=2980104 RepID=A0ABT3CXX0_9BACT|nr:polysaccharide pyruvyl transferase family protein [Reichenbachiella ulvae]MCV9388487.1 polysaccharide pyruvyl transferase family protein [Reichenbachiella ulvae]
MNIAIYGSYKYGNYGDELMAIVIANYIKSKGFKPIVYGLDYELAKELQIESTFSVTDLISRASVCLIGGGAFLSFGENSNLNPIEIEHEEEIIQLKNECLSKGCDVYCISIGGDGHKLYEGKMRYGRQDFFSSEVFKGGSIRLENDLKIFKNTIKSVEFVPDILWTTSKVASFNSELSNRESGKVRIGINLHTNKKSLINVLKFVSKFLGNIDLYFVKLHRSDEFKGEYLSKNESRNIKYDNPWLFLNSIRSLDLIVSHKLHLGITGLTFNVPFVSIGAKPKTISQLEMVNTGFADWNKSKTSAIIMFVKLFLFPKWFVKRVHNSFDWKEIERLKIEANRNFDLIDKICDEY